MSITYVCSPHVCGIHGSQKRVMDPLRLELQTVMRCHVGAENGTWILEQQMLLTTEQSLQPDEILDSLF